VATEALLTEVLVATVVAGAGVDEDVGVGVGLGAGVADADALLEADAVPPPPPPHADAMQASSAIVSARRVAHTPEDLLFMPVPTQRGTRPPHFGTMVLHA